MLNSVLNESPRFQEKFDLCTYLAKSFSAVKFKCNSTDPINSFHWYLCNAQIRKWIMGGLPFMCAFLIPTSVCCRFNLIMDVSCTYTPGSLSLLLDVESKSDIKKTKLQELFSKPQQLVFIQKIAVGIRKM